MWVVLCGRGYESDVIRVVGPFEDRAAATTWIAGQSQDEEDAAPEHLYRPMELTPQVGRLRWDDEEMGIDDGETDIPRTPEERQAWADRLNTREAARPDRELLMTYGQCWCGAPLMLLAIAEPFGLGGTCRNGHGGGPR